MQHQREQPATGFGDPQYLLEVGRARFRVEGAIDADEVCRIRELQAHDRGEKGSGAAGPCDDRGIDRERYEEGHGAQMDVRDVSEVHRGHDICGKKRGGEQRQAPPTFDARASRLSNEGDPEADEQEGKDLVGPPADHVCEAAEIVQLL